MHKTSLAERQIKKPHAQQKSITLHRKILSSYIIISTRAKKSLSKSNHFISIKSKEKNPLCLQHYPPSTKISASRYDSIQTNRLLSKKKPNEFKLEKSCRIYLICYIKN